jgi:DNA-binding NtrC family response regulator
MPATLGKRVLVADDDDDVRATLVGYLRAEGFEVIEATNGLDALVQLKRARPGAVVLDLLMPRFGGLETLTWIQRCAPETVVVVITGAVDPRLRDLALSVGAAAVLVKPLALPELRTILSQSMTSPVGAVGAPGAAPAVTEAARPTARRVLIADDDATIRLVLEDFLGHHGFVTRSVGDAASAFRAVMQEMPDVLLLDIAMPGLSGVEIIPAIRAVSSDVKIIMVSGITDVETSKRALAYGAFDYITKPVDMDYLLQSLETALIMKRLAAE